MLPHTTSLCSYICSGPLELKIVCCLHLKIVFRSGASVVWHFSLQMMNNCNKTEDVIFQMLPVEFPFFSVEN